MPAVESRAFTDKSYMKRLTQQEIQEWQNKTKREQSRFEFELCNIHEKILLRSLEFYSIEIDLFHFVDAGSADAKDLLDSARAKMEADISYLIWRNFN